MTIPDEQRRGCGLSVPFWVLIENPVYKNTARFSIGKVLLVKREKFHVIRAGRLRTVPIPLSQIVAAKQTKEGAQLLINQYNDMASRHKLEIKDLMERATRCIA